MLIATVILFTDFTGVGATTYIDYSKLRRGGGGGGGSVPRFALEFRNNLPQFNLLLGVHADQKIDAVAEAIVGRVQIDGKLAHSSEKLKHFIRLWMKIGKFGIKSAQ